MGAGGEEGGGGEGERWGRVRAKRCRVKKKNLDTEENGQERERGRERENGQERQREGRHAHQHHSYDRREACTPASLIRQRGDVCTITTRVQSHLMSHWGGRTITAHCNMSEARRQSQLVWQ